MNYSLLQFACATCMGNPDDAATSAAGSSILFMLFVLGVVLGGVAKFIHFLAKCERESTRMVPVSVEAAPPVPVDPAKR